MGRCRTGVGIRGAAGGVVEVGRAFLVGATIGYTVWRPSGSLAWLPLLPMAWGTTVRPSAAHALLAGYHLAAAREMVPAGVAYFGPGHEIPVGLAWGAQAALLAIPWWVLRVPGGAGLGRDAVVAAGALCAGVLPPFGWAGWGHPLLAAGAICPGGGWFGLCACALAMAAVAAVARNSAATACALSLVVILPRVGAEPPAPAPPAGWLAQDTRFGPAPRDLPGLQRRALDLGATVLAALERAPWTRVVVLPEGLGGRHDAATQVFWQAAGRAARRAGARVLVGAEAPPAIATAGALNALYDIDGAVPVAVARQPLPAVSWWPGQPWHVGSHWSGPPASADVAGLPVAFSFCFEDLLVLPHLLSFVAAPRPRVLVSVANVWWAEGLAVPVLQARAVRGWARLFGVPLVRAVNLPPRGDLMPGRP